MKNNLGIKVSLAFNFFVFAILLNSVGTVIMQVILNYGVGNFEASVLEPYKDLTIAAVSFLIGAYLPRIGYKRSMLIGLALITLICFYMPFTSSFAATKLLFFITGFSFALVKVSVYSTVGLITKDSKEHASLMSTLEGIFMIGVLVGYWLFSFYMKDDIGSDWLNVFWLIGGIALVAFLSLLFSKLDETEVIESKNVIKDFKEMLALILRPLVFVFVISAFLYVFIEQGIGTWLPTFNNQILNFPPDMSNQVASILAASAALGRLLAGQLLKKLDWLYLLLASLGICIVLIAVSVPLTRGLGSEPITSWGMAPMAAFLFPMIGFFLAPVYPTINSAILSSLPKGMHSSMTGLIVVFSALGGTTGSRITGYIFDIMDGQSAFLAYILPIGLLMLFLFLFKRQTNKIAH